jgi:hypothetical protein
MSLRHGCSHGTYGLYRGDLVGLHWLNTRSREDRPAMLPARQL